jgi:hypothetical protein
MNSVKCYVKNCIHCFGDYCVKLVIVVNKNKKCKDFEKSVKE